MAGFILGVIAGQLSIMAVVAALLIRSNRHAPQGKRRMRGPKKVDGIWTVKDERRARHVDPSRTRVRKAVILERTRRG